MTQYIETGALLAVMEDDLPLARERLGLMSLNERSHFHAQLEALQELIAEVNAQGAAPDPPCSGPGYAHEPHGGCPGYGTDRT